MLIIVGGSVKMDQRAVLKAKRKVLLSLKRIKLTVIGL